MHPILNKKSQSCGEYGADKNSQNQLGMVNQFGPFKYEHEGETQKGGGEYLNESKGEEIKFFSVYLHEDYLKGKRDRAEKSKKVA